MTGSGPRTAKKWPVLLLAAVLTVMPAGCMGVKQVNRISFVTVLGVEPGADGGVRVHALAAIPAKYGSLSPDGASSGVSSAPDYILSAEGADLSDALYKLKRKSARDIQFGHTKVVLFSDELARQGLANQMDFLMRREELQSILWIAITKGSPVPVMKMRTATPEAVGDWLVDIFSQAGSDTAEIIPIMLYQFYDYMFEPGTTPYAAVIEPLPDEQTLTAKEMAVFGSDKLLGTIPAEDVKYVSLLRNSKVLPTTFTLPEEQISFVLLNENSKIAWRNGRFKVRLELKLDLDQTSAGEMKANRLADAEAKLNEKAKGEIEKLLAELQRLHADPIGLGERYRLAHGGHLDKDEWLRRLFPEQTFDVQVKAEIQRKGMLE
ncbi:Ger(x)C family spore germination protein [Cohnella zeiphila]|uniref:Ger(X)C family spore germination protein n=1 Tax=Cohnella zeiphila TaxID=2761120 RepID=A0A7X0VYT8_9BACL|nr:Ger(x)C family spore germination protein [Cohnella zeiphila]MBB6733283.1 Ger(x)C family spore germination protein [Cohnella zeiphila]